MAAKPANSARPIIRGLF